jgi:predicted DNA-binding transcriptional regulator AlpA
VLVIFLLVTLRRFEHMTDVSRGAPDRLITERATAEILGISPDTLRRLNRRDEGPSRRKISPRRVGYKFSEVEAYRDGKPLQAAQERKAPLRRRRRHRSRAHED